jgi:type I restriction enzyme M protein
VISSVSGATDQERFHKFVLPLIFYKRLSDISEEASEGSAPGRGEEYAHRDLLEAGLVPEVTGLFDIPGKYRWEELRTCPPYELGYLLPRVLRVLAEIHPDLRWAFDNVDYTKGPGERWIVEPGGLAKLIYGLSTRRLGLKDISPSAMGDAFEYLLRKYGESQGRVAGNFYTPREVVTMMTHLLDTKADVAIYDPACGSGSLLVNARKFVERNNPGREGLTSKLYGREINTGVFVVAQINMLLHGYPDSHLSVADIWHQPNSASASNKDSDRFDLIVSNPPWNQNAYDFGAGLYRYELWEQFPYGPPPKTSADWGWLQHIKTSLSGTGRAAVVFDTGVVTRGSGSRLSNREKYIRGRFVEEDVVEAVVLLPKNLFYGTTSPAVVLFLNARKPSGRKGQILLVDVSSHFIRKGRKNRLTLEGMAAVSETYRRWEAREDLSRIISLEEARDADYNLLPSNFIEPDQRFQPFGKRVFISYSSKDELFTRRLRADLERRRIQCWFAPEDLKIGAKIRSSIDEAILKHDKLLLILSKHSIRSAWVEQEVETALAREGEMEGSETILFPISLDDEVFKSRVGWPALIYKTRNIGDFREWESAGKYQKALKRLLHNLTTGE